MRIPACLHACMPVCPHGVRVYQLQCYPALLGYAVESQIPLQCMPWVMVCYKGSLPMYNEGFAVTGHYIVGQCLISTENSWGASDAFNHVMIGYVVAHEIPLFSSCGLRIC